MITFVPQFGPGANRSTYGPVIFEVSLKVAQLLEERPMKTGDIMHLNGEFHNGRDMPKAMCFANCGYGEHPDNRIGLWHVRATTIRCKGEHYEVDFALAEEFVDEGLFKDQFGKTVEITVKFVARELTYTGKWMTKTPFEVPVGGWANCRAIAVAINSGWPDYTQFTVPNKVGQTRILQGVWTPSSGKTRQATAHFVAINQTMNTTSKITLDICLVEGSEELATLRGPQI